MSYSSMSLNGVRIEVRNGRVYRNGKLMVPAVPARTDEIPEEDLQKVLKLDQDGRLVGDIDERPRTNERTNGAESWA